MMKYIFNPVSNIVVRELSNENKAYLSKHAATIEELVNFGSQVLASLSDRNESKDKGDYNVVPITFLRQSLDLLDSISISVATGSAVGARILLRSLFEMMLYVEYLFKTDGDIKKKSYAYLTSAQIENIKYWQSLKVKSSGTTTNNDITITEEVMAEIQNHAEVKKELFELPGYKDAYKRYWEILKIDNKKSQVISHTQKNPKWYNYYDKSNNIFQLCEHLGTFGNLTFTTLYRHFYSPFSKYVHSSNVFDGNIAAGQDGKTDVFQLRYGKDINTIPDYCVMFASTIFKTYIIKLVPEQAAQLLYYINWMKNEIK